MIFIWDGLRKRTAYGIKHEERDPSEGRSRIREPGGGSRMQVTVKAFAGFREVMPREVGVAVPDGATAGDLLDILTDRYPALSPALFNDGGGLREYVNILKNGRNIHFTGDFATPLADGDVVALFPPAAGG